MNVLFYDDGDSRHDFMPWTALLTQRGGLNNETENNDCRGRPRGLLGSSREVHA